MRVINIKPTVVKIATNLYQPALVIEWDNGFVETWHRNNEKYATAYERIAVAEARLLASKMNMGE